MKILWFVAILGICGCANDRYVVIAEGQGSAQSMGHDLSACKHEALHSYFVGQSHDGVLVGAVLGGAAGGLLGGAIDGHGSENATAKINPDIEACMRSHGYEGTSEN